MTQEHYLKMLRARLPRDQILWNPLRYQAVHLMRIGIALSKILQLKEE